ncbi:hypothetical protein [Hydrogenophaga sp. BPS33]|uniref:hypothetical protein n=1 Tax=Hydrogenophaga sp. BPS33 TaxID=2651974 RepID=UPI001320385D|nr:hypothetical protein [Hydrogenophaga sp. BPS33]QHE86420.1 hypothetical protein F9K07_16675 [Hydrogenophaga sp. BPS33]
MPSKLKLVDVLSRRIRQLSQSKAASSIKWKLHWLAPNLMRHPHFSAGEADYHFKRDEKLNRETCPAGDEEIRSPMVWGLELYGPQEIGALYRALERFKWQAGWGRSEKESAIAWLQNERAYGRDGSWYNVGIVVPNSQRQNYVTADNYADPPKQANHLLVRLFQPTPSLTCLLIGFSLKEELASSYHNQLKLDRKSHYRRIRRRWAIEHLSPEHIKSKSIDDTRNQLQDLASNWFSKNAPGYFSNTISRVITAELITTKNQSLFPNSKNDHVRDWRSIVSATTPFNIWTLEDCPAMQFIVENRKEYDKRFHLITNLHTDKIPEDKIKHLGGHQPHAYTYFCHEHLDEILVNFAAIEFLVEVSKNLKTSTTSLKLDQVRKRTSAKSLEKIQRFFDMSIGTPLIASELKMRTEDKSLYSFQCSKFSATSLWDEKKSKPLAELLCEHTKYLASRTISEEGLTRDHFAQLANIVSVRESVKAQSRMEWLTLMALVVALISLWVSFSKS